MCSLSPKSLCCSGIYRVLRGTMVGLVGLFRAGLSSDARISGSAISTFILFGIFWIWLADLPFARVAALSFACGGVGALAGFLFGIPDILQSPRKDENGPTDVAYEVRISSRMTEIADWLTKIIVGLGLIHLSNVPSYVMSIARYQSQGMPEIAGAEAMISSFVVYFGVLGLFGGYVLTRLFLSRAFVEADRKNLTPLKRIVTERNSLINASVAALGQINGQEDAMRNYEVLAEEYEKARGFVQRRTAIGGQLGYLLRLMNEDTRIGYLQRGRAADQCGAANAICVEPKVSDALLILSFADQVTQNHVRYATLLAISEVLNLPGVGERERIALRDVIKKYGNDGDDDVSDLATIVLKETT